MKYQLESLAKRFFSKVLGLGKRFSTSEDYWQRRYAAGGNSGAGSYDKFAEFKADFLNRFVREHQVNSVIEFGCGDGNQLKLAAYPSYIGFDVSSTAVTLCKEIFKDDASKRFKLVGDYAGEVAVLSLSLDVVYHLVEDDVFEQYMSRLFGSSSKYIIIYSSNHDEQQSTRFAHVRHRKFTDWVDKNQPGWMLIQHMPNEFSPDKVGVADGSWADFFVYERK